MQHVLDDGAQAVNGTAHVCAAADDAQGRMAVWSGYSRRLGDWTAGFLPKPAGSDTESIRIDSVLSAPVAIRQAASAALQYQLVLFLCGFSGSMHAGCLLRIIAGQFEQ